MFVTVILGEGRVEIFNLNCRIVNFVHCLKERCNLDPQGGLDLMNRTGELMNLTESEHSTDLLSTLLRDRQSYILICIEGNEDLHYSTIHDGDIGNSNAELEEIFRKLSNPSKKHTKKGPPKKGSVNQLKNKTGTTSMKSIISAPST
ncbi:uncharacterized protein LOC118802311 isoform X2 [Colossoma macropomum]|uniref:uncharacterized protein LOC118802311 isoform X2 n=1 Tax=Colossoma macropomum TaxID=42526 RepID=UPI0018640E00|nr:uncharacterized protein LOC118802311 isoform X2 [Colossoma macropomum]